MPLFCFMFIQGEQLLDAARDGDMVSVRWRLLEEDPNLVRYKNSVRRSELCMHVCMYVCMLYTIVLALLHHLFKCICPSIYNYCHILITCTHTYIHFIFPDATSSPNPVFYTNLTYPLPARQPPEDSREKQM